MLFDLLRMRKVKHRCRRKIKIEVANEEEHLFCCNHLVEFGNKFWNGLSQHARQELLRVDRQTFLEQLRKNMFCSRCHGFLVQEFAQIAMYRQYDNVGHQDPYVDPWGCLTTTSDGTLTLLDRCLLSTYLEGIQKVFHFSRRSERERELRSPNSCGVGGRRWKGPARREACAAHTIPLSLDQLVEFWSVQVEETRQSLFRMKEEDFVGHLLVRLDNNRFCRECRQNVHREFKKIKELTSLRKESGIQFEISHDTVQADWSNAFIDTEECYHHFEWGIGTAEGKSDILDFKDVGLTKNVQEKGLDISGLDACYLTIRAWKIDGDFTELSIKSHTLKGHQYCTLEVGDGFVTVALGESLQNFFKHANEVVKEDYNLLDENRNRLDGGCSRPQGHPKSPEAARKFLLDAATIFFTERVQKAFQETIARWNAHSIFVSLALKMLEERAQVACKERTRLENQIKLLEEEEKEKEVERKTRKGNKERGKKLRRKERKENEKNGENCSPTKQQLAPVVNIKESTIVAVEPDAVETGKVMSSRPVSPHIQNEHEKDGYMRRNMRNSSDVSPDENFASSNDKNGSSGSDQLKYSGRKLNDRYQQDASSKCSPNKQFAVVPGSGIMINKLDDRFDTSSRTIIQQNKHSKSTKSVSRAGHISKSSFFRNKFSLGDYMHDSPQTEEVGEPKKLQMKHIGTYSQSADTARSCNLSGDAMKPSEPLDTPGVRGQVAVCIEDEDDVKKESKSSKLGMGNNSHNGFHLNKETCQYSTEVVDVCSYSTRARNPSVSNTSGSNSWSSCLSEGNSGPSSNTQVTEPLSNSESKGSCQQSVRGESSQRQQIWVCKSEPVMDKKQRANEGEPIRSCWLDKKRIHTPGKVSQENDNSNPHFSQAEDKGSSFFHFGGPLTLADAYRSDSLPSEDAIGGRNKGVSFKEYKLFASNKGITFSILGL
ncbi:uncharacterized protein LOC108227935 isoform X1 [Daucus carota subsp. sativus]|uniref:uncharacterized protein LOC108227935 isoform X1 n=1 Tax=Daucus carota subsp. sativus TaxID=79200 RepID=UPI0007EF13FB|nr:PREDICTED: uncharacterized protein LOC108227935 isoform X1 [Daucus carota subsp. sativus]